MRPNPKDEAIELYVKYRQYTFYVDLVYKEDTLDKFYENAKKCALIAVEYLIANEHLETGDESWWKQVKQELEKL